MLESWVGLGAPDTASGSDPGFVQVEVGDLRGECRVRVLHPRLPALSGALAKK